MYSINVTGLGMGESARWRGDRLWFADWLQGTICVVEPSGEVCIVARVPSFPISFDWLPDGRMLVVSGREGKLLVLEEDGLREYGDLSALSPHPWNELVIDAQGNAYVNGIGYEFPGPTQATGVIARVTPDGSAMIVATELAFPNGMVLTPDGSILIVGESHSERLTAYSVGADGTLADRTTWATVPSSAPDGVCWGADGAIWYADVPNRECVLVREGGGVVGRVAFDTACFSCAVSGESLFAMTAAWPLNFDPSAAPTGEIRSVPLRFA